MDKKSTTATLPTYSLFIHPADLRELRRDIWVDEPVPAKLTINKVNYHIGLAYRGNHIREFEKKSYLITFKKPAAFQKNLELHLNAEYLDTSLIRSKLSFDFFQAIGVLVPSTQYVFLKINGQKAGIFVEIESVDSLFFQKKNTPVKAIYYAVNSDANFSLISHYDKKEKLDLISGYEQKFGAKIEDQFLHEFIHNINTVPDFPKEVEKYLDVDLFLRWLAGVVCIQNFDSFHQNYSLYRSSENGLFGISPWDNEATWGRDCNGDIMEYDYIPVYGDNTNTLVIKLLAHQPFRKKYKAILEEILETWFNPEFLCPKITQLTQIIQPYIPEDPFIYKFIGEFEKEIALIQEYIKDRHHYLRSHLKDLH